MTADATTLSTTEKAPDVGAVERERVTDPVTGLPMLRYRFAGPPTLPPGMAAPAGAWRALRVEERDGRTTLELETAANAEPLDRHPSAVDDAVVEATVATLRLARACGAVHGGLGPRRLWRRGAQVWIEGYGVRWREDADAASDARDLAAGLLGLPGTRLSAAARARLAAILEAGDVDAATSVPPPAAEDVAATPSVDAPARPRLAAETATAPGTADDVAGPRVVRGPPPGSHERRGGTGVLALAARVGQQWWHRTRTSAAPLVEWLKDPAPSRSPGRTPAAERATDGPRAGLRPGVRLRLLIVLVIASFTWVALASWSERAAPSGRPPATVTGQVVDVTVSPAGHPPVGLVVVASPPGSSLAVGSVIASVPGKVWLDLDGRWSFEARLGERRSPTVDLVLPFERAVQLAFPSPAAP